MPIFSQSEEPAVRMTKGAYASVPEYYMLGPIQNLCRTGLSFQYVGFVESKRFHSMMDIFTVSGIFIRQIPFEMVSSKTLGNGSFLSADQNRLYKIRFNKLTQDQMSRIEVLISEFAEEIFEDTTAP